MATKTEIDLPKIVFVSDYHEFSHMENLLRELTGSKRIKVRETGFDGNQYIGVVYTKKDKDYKRAVKEASDSSRLLY